MRLKQSEAVGVDGSDEDAAELVEDLRTESILSSLGKALAKLLGPRSVKVKATMPAGRCHRKRSDTR